MINFFRNMDYHLFHNQWQLLTENISRTLEEDVDTGDKDKVRVGFLNVVLQTTAGEYGYFSNTSQIVER